MGQTTDDPRSGRVLRLDEITYSELDALERERLVAILPLGAVEAHGPHLPLSTDRVIALAMAKDGACRLAERGLLALLMPPVDYTAAAFAADFPGTVSLRPETATALLVDVALSVGRWGVDRLVFANSHFDPAHLSSIYAAIEEIEKAGGPEIVFPDVTRKPWALRLTDEFKSGACHAGRYEGSVVLARTPELVRNDVRARLEPNPSSLSAAIREGRKSFEEAGGPAAYFGDPASASAEEGRETIAILGEILAEAVLGTAPQSN